MANPKLNPDALVGGTPSAPITAPATIDGVHFVVVSFASRTTDDEVGVVKGTEFDADCNASKFECNVAAGINMPPMTKTSLDNLQKNGYFLTYPAPILGRTGYEVTVTDGLVTKVQRVWTDEEQEKIEAERKRNVLKDYASRFKKGGKQ